MRNIDVIAVNKITKVFKVGIMEFIEYSKKYKQDLEYFYETFVLEDKDINVDSLKDHF